jgi:hypothetical protein
MMIALKIALVLLGLAISGGPFMLNAYTPIQVGRFFGGLAIMLAVVTFL